MTSRIEYSWNLDGLVHEQKYYCSLSPIDIDAPPEPKATLDGNSRAYIDTNVTPDQDYHVRFSAVRNDIEKFSDEIIVSTQSSIIPTLFADTQGFWFDPSDFSTMFQDTAGTIPVTNVGQTVQKILDKSGNNCHLTGSATLGQDVDGYYLQFNGTNQQMTTPNLTVSNNITFVFRVKASAVSGFVFETLESSRWVFLSRFDAGYSSGSGGGSLSEAYIQTGAPSDIATTITGVSRVSPVRNILRFNSAQVASATDQQGSSQSSLTAIRIGARSNNSNYFSGKLYESLFICKQLTEAQLLSVESELS